jgi:Helix-turn-helix domain
VTQFALGGCASVLYSTRMETNIKLAVGIREAAAMLSISPRSVQNYISAKLLPARKIGRRTVIPVRALEAFLRTDHPSPSQRSGIEGCNERET